MYTRHVHCTHAPATTLPHLRLVCLERASEGMEVTQPRRWQPQPRRQAIVCATTPAYIFIRTPERERALEETELVLGERDEHILGLTGKGHIGQVSLGARGWA